MGKQSGPWKTYRRADKKKLEAEVSLTRKENAGKLFEEVMKGCCVFVGLYREVNINIVTTIYLKLYTVYGFIKNFIWDFHIFII